MYSIMYLSVCQLYVSLHTLPPTHVDEPFQAAIDSEHKRDGKQFLIAILVTCGLGGVGYHATHSVHGEILVQEGYAEGLVLENPLDLRRKEEHTHTQCERRMQFTW